MLVGRFSPPMQGQLYRMDTLELSDGDACIIHGSCKELTGIKRESFHQWVISPSEYSWLHLVNAIHTY